MALFDNKYPYTDFHELNLDYALKKVDEIEDYSATIEGYKAEQERFRAEMEEIRNIRDIALPEAKLSKMVLNLYRKVAALTGSANQFRNELNHIGVRCGGIATSGNGIWFDINNERCYFNLGDFSPSAVSYNDNYGKMTTLGGTLIDANNLARLRSSDVDETYKFKMYLNGQLAYTSNSGIDIHTVVSIHAIYDRVTIVLEPKSGIVVVYDLSPSGINISRNFIPSYDPSIGPSSRWESICNANGLQVVKSKTDGDVYTLQNFSNGTEGTSSRIIV